MCLYSIRPHGTPKGGSGGGNEKGPLKYVQVVPREGISLDDLWAEFIRQGLGVGVRRQKNAMYGGMVHPDRPLQSMEISPEMLGFVSR
jgi:hypothetical protein